MRKVSLDDKYTQESGRVYLTGMQALTLLPLLQRRRDLAAGLNTAGYISGYRGSPLGAYDLALWQARKHLDAHQSEQAFVAAGKGYLDVHQALELLGIDDRLASELGPRVLKAGMVWPLETAGMRAFAAGLDTVLVVEEKRALIETQLKETLYHAPTLPAKRMPWFCPGCPHNSPTRVPEGSRALAERYRLRVEEIRQHPAADDALAAAVARNYKSALAGRQLRERARAKLAD